MIEFAFEVPEEGSVLYASWSKAAGMDLEKITATALRYKLFYAFVDFSVNEAIFLSRSSFVPLADIAIGAARVAGNLANGSNGALSFTESDELIRFRLDGDRVVVVSTRHGSQSIAEKDELIVGLKRFSESAYKAIIEFRPDLSKNDVLAPLRG